MRIEKYDAFALKLYAFQLHKTNSFFTGITILISIAIVIISLVINIPTLSHIWLSRPQLPTLISTSIQFPDPLTFSLICYKSNTNASVPAARVLDQGLKPIPVQVLNENEVKMKRPLLARQIGNNFACLNFENIEFSPKNQQYIIEVFSSNATLYVEQTSTDSIIQDHYQDAIKIESSNPSVFKYLLVQIISAVVSDSLFVSYQPEAINSFLKSSVLDFQKMAAAPFQSPNIKFGIRLFSPNYISLDQRETSFNILNLSVTRYNIGFIVGTVTSWISTLVLILSFIIGPLMDYKHQLLLAQTLFLLKPELKKPNLFKFIIASYKSGIYIKEDHFVELAEEAEKLKDLSLILKTQKMVGKIYRPSSKALQAQIIGCQESFAEPYPFEVEPPIFSEGEARKSAMFRLQQDTKQQGAVTQMRRIFLKLLDTGTDEISVHYHGKGHGSKASVWISILFGLGFLAFLIIFGVFRTDKTTEIYSLVDSGIIDYEFAINQLFFTTYTSTDYSVDLLNGNYQYLSTVPLTSGPECLKMLRSASTVVTFDSLNTLARCLTEPLTLRYSPDPQETILLYFNIPESMSEEIIVSHNSLLNNIQQVNLIDHNYIVSYYSPFQQCYYMNNLKVVQKSQGNSLLKTSQILPSTGCLPNTFKNKPIVGYYMQIDQMLTVVQTNTPNIFDIMQNVWSLAVICFTVMLMKITKHINLHQKNINLTPIRAQFRENLCILLSKINTMLTGRHSNELYKAGYFLKDQLRKK